MSAIKTAVLIHQIKVARHQFKSESDPSKSITTNSHRESRLNNFKSCRDLESVNWTIFDKKAQFEKLNENSVAKPNKEVDMSSKNTLRPKRSTASSSNSNEKSSGSNSKENEKKKTSNITL